MQRLIDFVRKLKWYRKFKNNEKAQKILWYLEGVLEKYKTRLEFIKIEVSKTYTLPLWNLYELKEDVRWQAYSIYKDGTVKYVWNANITANWWKTYIWINRKSDVKTVVVINWNNKYYLWEVPSKKEISKLNTNLDREKLNVTILKGVKGVVKEKNKEKWKKLLIYAAMKRYGIDENKIKKWSEEWKEEWWSKIANAGMIAIWAWVVVLWIVVVVDGVLVIWDGIKKLTDVVVKAIRKVEVIPEVEVRRGPEEENNECKIIYVMYQIKYNKCMMLPKNYKKYLIWTWIYEWWSLIIDVMWKEKIIWDKIRKEAEKYIEKEWYRPEKDEWDWAVIAKIKKWNIIELKKTKNKKGRAIAVQDHHIITNKSKTEYDEIKRLFKELKVVDEAEILLFLNEWWNRWFLYPHCGSHCKNNKWYHVFVREATRVCVLSKLWALSWDERIEKFKEEFGKIRRFVLQEAKINKVRKDIEILDGWYKNYDLSDSYQSEEVAKNYICPDVKNTNWNGNWLWISSY